MSKKYLKYILLLVLLFFLIGIKVNVFKTPNPQLQLTTSPSPTTVQRIPEVIGLNIGVKKENITVPVKVLNTSYGINYPTKKFPQSITVALNPNFSDKVEAYGVGEMIVIGPKYWTGEGHVGADGTTSITLYERKFDETKPYVSFYIIPACWSCYLEAAAPFFPEAAEELKANKFSLPEFPQNLEKYYVNPSLVVFNYPSEKSSLNINGITSVNLKDKNVSAPFISIKTAFPKEEINLSSVLINNFIENNLNNLRASN